MLVIQGSVFDTSAGTQLSTVKADFPSGVPVCSDASMQAWMGYVYQQQAEPTNFTELQKQTLFEDLGSFTKLIYITATLWVRVQILVNLKCEEKT